MCLPSSNLAKDRASMRQPPYALPAPDNAFILSLPRHIRHPTILHEYCARLQIFIELRLVPIVYQLTRQTPWIAVTRRRSNYSRCRFWSLLGCRVRYAALRPSPPLLPSSFSAAAWPEPERQIKSSVGLARPVIVRWYS